MTTDYVVLQNRTARTLRGLVAGVMEYDGCVEGKLDFLRDCGVPVPDGVEENDEPLTVLVTVAMRVDPTVLREEASDVEDAVTRALDDADFVDGASAYVTRIEDHGTADPSTFRNAGTQTSVADYGGDERSNEQIVDAIMAAVVQQARS